MQFFIVALPLFTQQMEVEAYRLVFERGDKPLGLAHDYSSLSNSMYSPGIDIINQIGIEPFTGGAPLIIDINQFQLLAREPMSCKAERSLLICALSSDVTADDMFKVRIKELVDSGIRLAINGLPLSPETEEYYKAASYIILSNRDSESVAMYATVRRRFPNLHFVLTEVKDEVDFNTVRNYRNTIFTGNFYNVPITSANASLSSIKANALSLLSLSDKEDFDLNAASDIIKRDPSITLSLLKFINSSLLQSKQKVSSINNAVALLGQKELKRWIAVTV